MHNASPRLSRRRLLATGAGAMVAASFPLPGLSQAAARPVFTHGVQSGDVDADSRHDLDPRRPAVAGDVRGLDHRKLRRSGPRCAPLDALPDSDFAVKRLLDRPAVRPGHLLPHDRGRSRRHQRRLRADRRPLPHRAGLDRRNVRFAWSGDTAGQGWGIDETAA